MRSDVDMRQPIPVGERITRCLEMRERSRFVRDKMGSGCPPGKEDCEGLYPTCMECVARYILGDEDGR